MKQSYLASIDGAGIGAVTVHPSKKYIVVAEVRAASPHSPAAHQQPDRRHDPLAAPGLQRRAAHPLPQPHAYHHHHHHHHRRRRHPPRPAGRRGAERVRVRVPVAAAAPHPAQGDGAGVLGVRLQQPRRQARDGRLVPRLHADGVELEAGTPPRRAPRASAAASSVRLASSAARCRASSTRATSCRVASCRAASCAAASELDPPFSAPVRSAPMSAPPLRPRLECPHTLC